MRNAQIIPTVGLLSLLIAGTAQSQSLAAVEVVVEIEAPALKLSVSSARLNFGRLGADAQGAQIDPSTGIRGAGGAGVLSMAGITLTGQPHHTFVVHVAPPNLRGATPTAPSPRYAMTWAESRECTGEGFELLANASMFEGAIGEGGCTRYRFGGALSVNNAPPGIYKGVMTVTLAQL